MRTRRKGAEADVYNPLHKRHLGESIARAVLHEPIHPLPPDPFVGAGVYAIYYQGGFPPYARIAAWNKQQPGSLPIYVGKAVPKGSRKGGIGLEAPPGPVLYDRLRQHAESIDQVSNLELVGFSCRFMAVDDIWIPLGESLLIERFSPLWNRVIDGFGIHLPGKGREAQRRSQWDIVHPGRRIANRLASGKQSEGELLGLIARGLASVPNPPGEI